MILFIELLLAHLLGDFIWQPTRWVREKERLKYRSPKVYLHALLHFLLILVITGGSFSPLLAAAIAISHLAIDIAKLQWQRPRNKKLLFFIDQLLHLSVIGLAAWFADPQEILFSPATREAILIITTGLVFLTTPVSVTIKIILSQWTPFTEGRSDTLETKSLQHAGMVIGMIERILVFIFILYDQWAAIGFLITAKSVFRFSDLKIGQDRKLTEYILIGTLLSFGIAIITGIVVEQLLRLGI